MFPFILIALAAIVLGSVFGFKAAGKRIQTTARGLTAGQTLVQVAGVVGGLIAAFYSLGWALIVGVWVDGGLVGALCLTALGAVCLVGSGFCGAYLSRFVHFASTSKSA